MSMTCNGFRGLAPTEFRPGRGVNVIRGGNAQGKTSLLEALLYLVTSKSHRTNSEPDLVQYGQRGFQIRAAFQRNDREVRIEANWWENAKRFKVNEVAQTRISDILGKVHLVFFSPEDVDLVRGSAAQRRRFLDMEISQIAPAYLHALQQYRQALRQRNELLRRPPVDPVQLDVWDAQLAAHGEVVQTERTGFVDQLKTWAADVYSRIADGEPLRLRYRPDIRAGATFTEVLRNARGSDLRQGVTTRGPHRDEVEIEVAERDARRFASQGQQRTAALALKFAELELIRARCGEYPLLLLDDVLSELDADRSQRMFGALNGAVQVILTTTDLTDHDGLYGADCTFFRIREGRLETD